MPSKNFLQLQTALSSLWGYNDPTLFDDPDRDDIKGFINAAYFDCYAPPDSTRPNYGEANVAKILKAPVVTTLGLTHGSKDVTGYTFDAAHVGSFVKIGDTFYRYGSTSTLVEPWQGDTGNQTATVYHNAVALDTTVIEVAGMPSILGVGTLKPIPGPDWELTMRSEPVPDFQSKNARSPFTITRNRFNPSLYYDTGEPRYYHIDSSSVAVGFTLGDRLHVYPVPDRIMTVTFRASVIPAALSADGDTPQLPAASVDNILLPLARERLAESSAGRRFTGNTQLIMNAADRARAQLKSLGRKQRHTAGGFRMKRGW